MEKPRFKKIKLKKEKKNHVHILYKQKANIKKKISLKIKRKTNESVLFTKLVAQSHREELFQV